VLLSGCATTVPARVTTFQQWPADAVGQTWRFGPGNAQRDDLEHRDYADQIRGAMGPTGLVEAKAGETARFIVAFSDSMEPTRVLVQTPAYDPWGGPFGRRFGWGPYPPGWTTSAVDVWRATLRVEISDAKQDNRRVYESTAVSTGATDSLPRVMPYLVRAIFDHFPDTNGQVREVELRSDSR